MLIVAGAGSRAVPCSPGRDGRLRRLRRGRGRHPPGISSAILLMGWPSAILVRMSLR